MRVLARDGAATTGHVRVRLRAAIALVALPLAVSGVLAAEPDNRELTARALYERAPRWRCAIVQQYHCTEHGCREVPPTVTIVLDFARRRYERCDANGCGRHSLSVRTGGIYTTLSPGPGTFLKVVNDGSRFVEVTSAAMETFTGYGRCERTSQ